MSSYSGMKASPFWKSVMRTTGILCFVTLMTPPVYYMKYALLDRPVETAIALSPAAQPQQPPSQFRFSKLEQNRAEHAASPAVRLQAIAWLKAIVVSPYAQVTHPFECLQAKTTLGQVGMTDSNPAIRIAATNALVAVAAGGAVIKR